MTKLKPPIGWRPGNDRRRAGKLVNGALDWLLLSAMLALLAGIVIMALGCTEPLRVDAIALLLDDRGTVRAAKVIGDDGWAYTQVEVRRPLAVSITLQDGTVRRWRGRALGGTDHAETKRTAALAAHTVRDPGAR